MYCAIAIVNTQLLCILIYSYSIFFKGICRFNPLSTFISHGKLSNIISAANFE